ncbi:hypothetical protein [Ekhidna sp.]|uniref:hypothetical protein n=1 Tax=Ekhidna sp. TaxID=2608089 RepID=UPI003B503701
MNIIWFRLKNYLAYKINAVGPHSLHSPFVFELYYKAIKPANNFRLPKLEELRKELINSDKIIDLYDLKSKSNYRKPIGAIAKTSLSSPKFSAFLNRLIDHLEIVRALETGTSLGINALYMAGTESIKKLVTIEASPILATIARKQFTEVFQHKIKLKEGTIQDTFEAEVISLDPELCFIDADHRSTEVKKCINVLIEKAPSIKCIIIHDIYWSEDMNKEWTQIVNDKRFSLSIDIFQAGIIFPNLEMPKQHFKLRF